MVCFEEESIRLCTFTAFPTILFFASPPIIDALSTPMPIFNPSCTIVSDGSSFAMDPTQDSSLDSKLLMVCLPFFLAFAISTLYHFVLCF